MADNSDGRLKQAKLGINIIAYLIEKSDFDEKQIIIIIIISNFK